MKMYLIVLFLVIRQGSAKDDESCFRAWRGCYADIQLPTTQTVFLPEWNDETFERTCRNITNIVECSENVEDCERYRKNMNLAIDRAMVWVCKEGFTEFKTNRKCFKEKNDEITLMTSHCSQTLDKNLKRIKHSRQHNVEIVNEFCRELNNTMSCYVKWVDKSCGSSAAKWFVMFNDNLINEHSNFLRCSEINPGDTTMTKLVFAAILLCVLIVPALILVCLIMYRKRKLRMSQSTSTINAPRSTRSSPLSHTRNSNRNNHHGNTDSSRYHHHHNSFKQNPNNQRQLKSRYQRQNSDKPSEIQNSSAPLLNSAKSSRDEEALVLEIGQLSSRYHQGPPIYDKHGQPTSDKQEPPIYDKQLSGEDRQPGMEVHLPDVDKEPAEHKQLHTLDNQTSNKESDPRENDRLPEETKLEDHDPEKNSEMEIVKEVEEENVKTVSI